MGEFGENLRTAREAAGMSQAQLALGVLSASHLSLLEAGKRRPSLEVVCALAHRLGVPADDICDEMDALVRERAADALALCHDMVGDGQYECAVRLATKVLTSPGDAGRRASALYLRSKARMALGHPLCALRDLHSAQSITWRHTLPDLKVGIEAELAHHRRQQDLVLAAQA